MASLRNLDAYLGSQDDWTLFNGCFGCGNIAPMDIDGVVEHNGSMIATERKPLGVDLDKGHYLTLQTFSLSRGPKGQRHYAIVVRGDPITDQWWRGTVQMFRQGELTPEEPCDLERLRGLYRHWYDRAHTYER